MTFTGLVILILELDKRAADEFTLGGAPAVVKYIDTDMLPRLRDGLAKHEAAGNGVRTLMWSEHIKVIMGVREKIDVHYCALAGINARTYDGDESDT